MKLLSQLPPHTDNWVFTLTTNWTDPPTQTRGARFVSIYWGDWGLFRVCRTLLRTFYVTVVASAVFYAIVCWGCGCTERDSTRLNKLVRRASRLDCPLDSTEEAGEEDVSEADALLNFNFVLFYCLFWILFILLSILFGLACCCNNWISQGVWLNKALSYLILSYLVRSRS